MGFTGCFSHFFFTVFNNNNLCFIDNKKKYFQPLQITSKITYTAVSKCSKSIFYVILPLGKKNLAANLNKAKNALKKTAFNYDILQIQQTELK